MSERDRAIIEEAYKRARASSEFSLWENIARKAAQNALELDRSGWQPTDQDVLAVRDMCAAAWDGLNDEFAAGLRAGEWDDWPPFLRVLAAYKKHKGGVNAAD